MGQTVDIQAASGQGEDTEGAQSAETLPNQDTAQAPDTSDHAATQSEKTDQSEQGSADESASGQAQAKTPHVPFANGGKEKFKVNGQEVEWDWPTTQRYAQMGKSGQLAMERAAEVERKAKDAYAKLYEAAQRDPEGLIQTLNPTWQPRHQKARAQTSSAQLPNGKAAATAQTDDEAAGESLDPRDEKIATLERRLAEIEQQGEQARINEERGHIQKELDTAVKTFPQLDLPIYRELVLAQYAKHLKAGIENITIEDVAFAISEQLKETRQKEVQAQKQKIDENRKRAPVSAVPGDATPTKAPKSFDDVRRMAGLL